MFSPPNRTAYVLGAYGLIGAPCVRALKAAGFHVIGVGRSARSAEQSNLNIEWRLLDIAKTSAETWQHTLNDAEIIVNASGALQTGSNDNLQAIHVDALRNLTEALDGSSSRFIQISAAGVSPEASTEFFRSKARGDSILQNTKLDWYILRPTLVLGQQAYGGTALLRASAAFPAIGINIFPNSPIQTVALEDVANAITACALGHIETQTDADLTESDVHTFSHLTTKIRNWQGPPCQ